MRAVKDRPNLGEVVLVSVLSHVRHGLQVDRRGHHGLQREGAGLPRGESEPTIAADAECIRFCVSMSIEDR